MQEVGRKAAHRNWTTKHPDNHDHQQDSMECLPDLYGCPILPLTNVTAHNHTNCIPALIAASGSCGLLGRSFATQPQTKLRTPDTMRVQSTDRNGKKGTIDGYVRWSKSRCSDLFGANSSMLHDYCKTNVCGSYWVSMNCADCNCCGRPSHHRQLYMLGACASRGFDCIRSMLDTAPAVAGSCSVNLFEMTVQFPDRRYQNLDGDPSCPPWRR
jgi:hypothetical protein